LNKSSFSPEALLTLLGPMSQAEQAKALPILNTICEKKVPSLSQDAAKWIITNHGQLKGEKTPIVFFVDTSDNKLKAAILTMNKSQKVVEVTKDNIEGLTDKGAFTLLGS
jgi:hypothetical protein